MPAKNWSSKDLIQIPDHKTLTYKIICYFSAENCRLTAATKMTRPVLSMYLSRQNTIHSILFLGKLLRQRVVYTRPIRAVCVADEPSGGVDGSDCSGESGSSRTLSLNTSGAIPVSTTCVHVTDSSQSTRSVHTVYFISSHLSTHLELLTSKHALKN